MRLPTPPNLDELQTHIPRIEAVSQDVHRPFWSVMIPTYNCGDYLRRTLASVLSQDPGLDEMQIEVVDGCSTKGYPERIVQEMGGGRVHYYRMPANQGPTGTFNTCIERSRGRWVHILHGDDMVLPGFYAAYRAMIGARPQVVMVTGKVVTIDEEDRWLYLSPVGPTETPLIRDFARRQAVEQQASFPTVVVKREAYEQVGGFCSWFNHAADLDMWFRVGLTGPVARVPAAYALFRKHTASDTNRFTVSAMNIQEFILSNLVNIARLKEMAPDAVICTQWKRNLANYAEEWAWRLDASGSLEGRLNQAQWAWKLHPTPHRFAFLIRSWMKMLLVKRCQSQSAPVIRPQPNEAPGKTALSTKKANEFDHPLHGIKEYQELHRVVDRSLTH